MEHTTKILKNTKKNSLLTTYKFMPAEQGQYNSFNTICVSLFQKNRA